MPGDMAYMVKSPMQTTIREQSSHLSLSPKSHTRPQCKSSILLPCYKMYEVGTDREGQRTKNGGSRRQKDLVTYTRLQSTGVKSANIKIAN